MAFQKKKTLAEKEPSKPIFSEDIAVNIHKMSFPKKEYYQQEKTVGTYFL